MSDLGVDLNKTITAAVTAKIEASVMEAFTSDGVLASYVTAALMQPMTVKNPNSYRDEKVPFVHAVLQDAIQKATRAAVEATVADNRPMLEEAIAKALRAQSKTIAAQMVGGLGTAGRGYISVQVNYSPRED